MFLFGLLLQLLSSIIIANVIPDPGVPESISAEPVSTTSVSIEWLPPVNKNGILTNYSIFWQAQGSFSQPLSAEVDNSTTSYIVSQLQTCVSYNFSVAASTTAGVGEPAFDISTTNIEGIFSNN